MKLLQRYNENNEANDLAELLENNGIPATVNISDMKTPGIFLPDAIEVWVYENSQYTDAAILLKDKSHIVKNKIDIEEFYKEFDSKENKEILAKYKSTFIKYGLLFIATVFTIIYLAIN